jgi:multidrug efflux pump subunit AcrA (membrane-fusion protein)
MTPHVNPQRLKTIGRRVKAPAAAIGAAVLFGMGAFSFAFNQTAAAGASVRTPIDPTVTQTTDARQPATPFASPTVTARPFVGGHWSDCA